MNPATGTFTQMDAYAGTIFDPVSLHKYLYANANPVMNRDPSGYYTIADGVVTFSIVEILAAAVVCVGFVAILGILQHNGYAPIYVGPITDGMIIDGIWDNISIEIIFSIRDLILEGINDWVFDGIVEVGDEVDSDSEGETDIYDDPTYAPETYGYDGDAPTRENVGHSKGDAPRDNKKQNEQTDNLTKKLTPKDRRRIHDEISGEGNGWKELAEIVRQWFGS